MGSMGTEMIHTLGKYADGINCSFDKDLCCADLKWRWWDILVKKIISLIQENVGLKVLLYLPGSK